MIRKSKAAPWISWILDGVVFVFDPILGIVFFIADLLEGDRMKRLIDEETKSDHSLL